VRQFRTILWSAISSALISPAIASACSVCMGNRDSDLVKGAEAGVFLMVLITYTVLLSFAGMTAFWFVRSKRAAASRRVN
jgi:hypothetical protein